MSLQFGSIIHAVLLQVIEPRMGTCSNIAICSATYDVTQNKNSVQSKCRKTKQRVEKGGRGDTCRKKAGRESYDITKAINKKKP